MLEVREIYNDIYAAKPVKVKINQQKYVDKRVFVSWLKEQHPHISAGIMKTALYYLPELLTEFVADTGQPLKLEGLGFLRPRYRRGKFLIGLVPDKQAMELMNNVPHRSIKYVLQDDEEVQFGSHLHR